MYFIEIKDNHFPGIKTCCYATPEISLEMSGGHWSWTLPKFQDMTGGHAVQMQKTAEAIMHNSKKKAMLVEIPEDISDNPIVAPSKANHKVFIY